MTAMTQLAIGIIALSAAGSFAVDAVLPEPPRIEIHSISYADGQMTQDRTIRTDKAAFQMHWSAVILDVATGNVVPWCQGSGDFPYTAGRKAKTMALPIWVGNDACTPESLPAGRYEPMAVYSWGDEQVIGHGEAFEVVK